MKNRIGVMALLLCTLTLVCFSGCSNKKGAANDTTAAPVTSAEEDTTSATEDTTADATVGFTFTNIGLNEKLSIDKDGSSQQIEVAECDISFPKVEGDGANVMNINSFYENILEKQTVYFRDEFYPMACDDYKFAEENDGFFKPYSMQSDFWAACNDEEYFSVVRAHTEYNGGTAAHTTLACETFVAETGALMDFADLFSADENVYMDRLIEIMTEQAKEKQDLYDDYPELLRTAFDSRDFYIHKDSDTDEKSLVIVYQPYDIAPGSVGTVDFSIDMKLIDDILK